METYVRRFAAVARQAGAEVVLPGDVVERAPRFLQPVRLQPPEPLPALPGTVHEASAGEGR